MKQQSYADSYQKSIGSLITQCALLQCLTTLIIVGVKRLFISVNPKDECTLGIPQNSIPNSNTFSVQSPLSFQNTGSNRMILHSSVMNYSKMIIVQIFCGYHQDIVNGHNLLYLRLQGTQYAITCILLFNGFWKFAVE